MENTDIFAMVPLRGVALFPGMTLHFDVGRPASLAALEHCARTGEDIFFITQKDVTVEKPGEDDFYPVGVVGTVRQVVKLPDRQSVIRVIADGKYRASIDEFISKRRYFKVKVNKVEDDYTIPDGMDANIALMQDASLFSIRKYFDDYAEHIPQMTPEMLVNVYEGKELNKVTDYIAANIMFSMEDKQKLLSTENVFKRAEIVCGLLSKETEILLIDEELQEKVQEQVDKNQREYYLREELKAITDELNDLDGDDATGLLARINETPLPEKNREKLMQEFERLKRLASSSADANVLRSYIEKCLEIPWGKYTKENTSLKKAVSILEKDHYGLKDVKERITEMIAAIMISPDIKGQIICLAGPPGVGKTSVAKSIARATGRKYVRISLGGVKDEAEIRGHRKTYIGAMPGRIINGLIEAKSMNALVLLDEIDKLGGDFRGDPASALLEVLDGEQNFSFRDHYIELPVDLSKVLFITTANDRNAIPGPLRDRMEIIDIPGYTYEEKFNIAKKHIVPKQMKEHSLTKDNIRITDAALREVIDGYTREAGVRILERNIAALCRKEAVRLADGNMEKLEIKPDNLSKYLGVKKYRPENIKHENLTGVVNGLAWTAVGGTLLKVEAIALDGTGKIELTGSLGDVMKESVRTAVSFVRSRAEKLGIEKTFYKTKDIHVHFPEGAVPKDGPSAGITETTALVSALTGKKVRGDIAMTGEVTLTGRVLAIGGLREKSMAAYKEGIYTVIIPEENVPDLEEVDEAVKAKVNFIPVKHVDEVLSLALIDEDKKDIKSEKKHRKEIVIPQSGTNEGVNISCEKGDRR